MSEDYVADLILDAQLVSRFPSEQLSREDIITFCTNTMMLSVSNILADIHDEKFMDPVECESEEGEDGEDPALIDLKDLVTHLFFLMNELGLDCEEYQGVVECKETFPIILRTDCTLALMALMSDIGALTADLWNFASDSNFSLGLIVEDQELPAASSLTDEEMSLEDMLVSSATSILAWADTIAHHRKSSLRKVILG